MQLFGVVCEYNPFHRGHAWHLAETRRRLGGEWGCVCVMSGHFVQRGEGALLPKESRAAMAVRGGADLVLELPLPAALSSADRFAQGAVAVLEGLGGVDCLSFGSECGNAAALTRAAQGLDGPAGQQALRRALRAGLSYPAACQQALEAAAPGLSGLLAGPNDLLGLSYVRAIRRAGSAMAPLAIPRRGAGHDAADPQGGFASAGAIRRLLRDEGLDSCRPYLPPETEEELARQIAAGAAPAEEERLGLILLTALRLLPEDAFQQLPFDSEGLGHRLRRAAREAGDWPQLLTLAKSRRYPMSRVKRTAVAAALGLTRQDEGLLSPPYLRVLALNRRGRDILRQAARRGALPQVVKPLTAWRTLAEPAARRLLALDARAADLYALALPSPAARRGGRDIRLTPYVLDHAHDPVV